MSARSKIILLTGGGSGGHITPLISVAEVLAQEAPEYTLAYVGQKNDPMVEHIRQNPLFKHVYVVRAGKFRRYHGEGIKQLLDIKTMFKNARDLVYVCIGFFQSLALMTRLKPKVLFCKGGYVGVPLGLAAAVKRIPYVTHDSDVVPGLANKLIGRWASVHAVALPKEQYTYPSHKTVTVGVPVQKRFKKVTEDMQQQARVRLGIPKTAPVLLVIGGGQGAEAINRAVLASAQHLLTRHSKLHMLHVAGQKSEHLVRDSYSKMLGDAVSRVQVFGYTQDVATLGEAATIVITRAGATNLAEFSLQAKACIIIPHPGLAGGHQLKNAKVYAEAGAALVLQEEQFEKLEEVVTLLLGNAQKRHELSERIEKFAMKNAAQSLAGVILTASQKIK